MNPDRALEILNIKVDDKIVHPDDIVKKSFYEFDLNTMEGITSFLTVLPITSDELLMQACQEVFPGYIVEQFDVKLARLELRGYFLDYLRTHQEELEDEEQPDSTQ